MTGKTFPGRFKWHASKTDQIASIATSSFEQEYYTSYTNGIPQASRRLLRWSVFSSTRASQICFKEAEEGQLFAAYLHVLLYKQVLNETH